MPTGPKPTANPQRPDQRRHQIKNAEPGGWAHGDPNDKRRKFPKCPESIRMAEAVKAWDAWFQSWWAAFWLPEDLPALELVITLYEGVMLGKLDPSKLTPLLDRYGITPKGRQDLRWAPPATDPAPTKADVPDEVGAKRKARKLA